MRRARRGLPAASSARAGIPRGTAPCAARDRLASRARGSRCAASWRRRSRSRAPRSPARSAPGTPKRCSIARKRRAMLLAQLASLRGERVERGLFQVLRRRLHEFRLRRLAVRPARDDEIGQRQIRLEPARRRIEGRARTPSAGGRIEASRNVECRIGRRCGDAAEPQGCRNRTRILINDASDDRLAQPSTRRCRAPRG